MTTSRHKSLGIAIAFAALALAVASAAAAGSTVVRFEQSFTQEPVECFTEPILFTGFVLMTFGQQINENGVHDHGAFIQQYTGIGLETGDRYVAHTSDTGGGFVVDGGARIVRHSAGTVRIIHTGESVSGGAVDDYAAHGTTVFVMNANGEIVVEKSSLEIECQ